MTSIGTLVERHRPRILAIAGVTAYRTAFGHPRAVTGPQPQPQPPDGPRVWVLPNPSGLNAHWRLDAIATAFSAVRTAADTEDQTLFPERTVVLAAGDQLPETGMGTPPQLAAVDLGRRLRRG